MGTLVYDGECPLCRRLADWARRILPEEHEVVAYQGEDLARFGLTEREAAEAVYWVGEGEKHRGHHAVAEALRAAGTPWHVAGDAIDAPLVDGLSARVYDWVSRNRHRLGGRRTGS